jgi:hypothetical protein
MTALAERSQDLPANVEQHPATDTGSLLQIISRAASDQSVDIDKMERLMAMHERLVARDAEQAFNAALTAAQTEMRPIAADADNPQTRSKYASYAALDKALRPIYTKHGFALSFDEGDTDKPEHIRVLCYVSHKDGFTRTYRKDMPADGKGARGGDVMTKTHASGAADTYGMRYLLKKIFNVAIGEDKDGNVPGAVISEEQAMQLSDLLDSVADMIPGATRERQLKGFLKYMKVTAIRDINAADYQRAVDAINSTRPAK